MVEQMVNSKFGKYGLGNCGSLLATGDKQPPVAIKKVGLRDLQNDNGTTVSSKSFGKIPSERETNSTENATPILGAKNPIPDLLSSPPRLQSPGSNSTNPHLVYARRKSEAEVIKRISEQTYNAGCPESEQSNKKRAIITESKVEGKSEIARIPLSSTVETCFPDSLRSDQRQLVGVNPTVACVDEREQHWSERRRISEAKMIKPISEPTYNAGCPESEQSNKKRVIITESKVQGKSEIARIPMSSTAETCFSDSLRSDQRELVGVNPAVARVEEREQHWSERFVRLQNYLKLCDYSNQEAYVQKVRSFTAEELSKHAVELEKRAIHLLLEEGRELQRMKVLNVLGKVCSK